MDKKQFAKTAGKKTAATLTLPVLVYEVMIIAYAWQGYGFLNIFTGPGLSSIFAENAYNCLQILFLPYAHMRA